MTITNKTRADAIEALHYFRGECPPEYAAEINAAIAELNATPALEVVPDGYHPYPEPHSKEGVKVGPGYIQLVGYGISSTTIRLHPDWRLMRRVDEGTQEASDGS